MGYNSLDIEFVTDRNIYEDGVYSIPLVNSRGEVNDDTLGDQICVSKDRMALEVSEWANIEDKEVKKFIKDNFKSPQAILGYIAWLFQ